MRPAERWRWRSVWVCVCVSLFEHTINRVVSKTSMSFIKIPGLVLCAIVLSSKPNHLAVTLTFSPFSRASNTQIAYKSTKRWCYCPVGNRIRKQQHEQQQTHFQATDKLINHIEHSFILPNTRGCFSTHDNRRNTGNSLRSRLPTHLKRFIFSSDVRHENVMESWPQIFTPIFKC